MYKLTSADVLNIRAQLEDGVPRKELALRYGVATETIAKIARRNTFVRVGEEQISDSHMTAMAKESQTRLVKALQDGTGGPPADLAPTADGGALSPELVSALFGA